MADQLKVRLVTPERILVDQAAESVEIPAKNGSIDVLYGHAPLIAEIGAGEVRLHGGEAGNQRYAVARGFVEVLPDRVTILAESAQKPEEIDTAAVREQLQHGQQLWNEAGEDAEKYKHANEVIAEAEAKLTSGGEKSS
ncbi:MAG TPA: ATP synthase F1 subunit epsilon [Acidobacteriaceae bacterium]|jgi:F-type H+-transporting ATPase subunit epsilon|nr:ATP synthase F1 subunit epsilon [Acidobacteriaceae bacterium]